MMEYRVLTEDAYRQISSDMPLIARDVVAGTLDLEEYFGESESSWMELVEYPCTLPESLGERRPGESPGSYDARLAREFYGTAAALSKREASDGRLWTTLALLRYREYVQRRFFDRDRRLMAALDSHGGGPTKAFVARVQRRFTYSGRPSTKMFENGIARLWWLAYLVQDDDDAADPLHLLPVLLKSEKFADHLCRSHVSWSREATLGILDAVGRFLASSPKVASVSRFLAEDFVQYLNQRSLVLCFDCFAREEMAAYCLRYLDDAARG